MLDDYEPPLPTRKRSSIKRPGWRGEGQGLNRAYHFLDTGLMVRRCGHPTALYPWYGETPDGRMILGEGGGAFQFLDEAQAAVENWYQGCRES